MSTNVPSVYASSLAWLCLFKFSLFLEAAFCKLGIKYLLEIRIFWRFLLDKQCTVVTTFSLRRSTQTKSVKCIKVDISLSWYDCLHAHNHYTPWSFPSLTFRSLSAQPECPRFCGTLHAFSPPSLLLSCSISAALKRWSWAKCVQVYGIFVEWHVQGAILQFHGMQPNFLYLCSGNALCDLYESLFN